MQRNSVSSNVASGFSDHALTAGSGISPKVTPFDKGEYRSLIRAREKTIRDTLRRITPVLRLRTALDAGAGVGFFAQTLMDCGLDVTGFDGREENAAEARRRYPRIPFEQGDLQEPSILALGKFDLVLCFGLLYHLENPLLAVRHLRGLTEKCLLLESMCVPDDQPSLLLRESRAKTTRALRTWPAIPARAVW